MGMASRKSLDLSRFPITAQASQAYDEGSIPFARSSAETPGNQPFISLVPNWRGGPLCGKHAVRCLFRPQVGSAA